MTDSLVAAAGISALVFLICGFLVVRFKRDATKTCKELESERKRAELAEDMVMELQQYITTQDQTNQALRESRERLRRAVYHDALTELPNRDLFLENLKFLLEKKKASPDFNFAVLFLDLNRFKTINESLGHTIGDKLIKCVAERLKELIGKNDTLARLGGDDFGVILSNCGTAEDVTRFVETVNNRMIVPFSVGSRQIFVKTSIGVAFGHTEYNKSEEILRDADIAMHSAKDSNQKFTIFKQTMHARAVNLHQLETDLRYALDRKEFEPYFQPIICLESLQIVGFETLIRWNHPRRGLVSPAEFIPLCEESGMIVPLTNRILRESCEVLSHWQQHVPNLTISVNLSGKHFSEEGLIGEIQKILKETNIKPNSLKLEITESAVMENAEKAIETLRKLKSLGTQILIDDFGTGYSSLSYLHRFPVDTIKIDRSFVGTMESATENGEIVSTVITLAKTLNMKVIAEGVETVHQLHQLRVLGCEMGQGYLFSRPVPINEASHLLTIKKNWQNYLPSKHPMMPAIPAMIKNELPILEIGEI